MRTCPKCGYEDYECWRNLRFSLFQQYAHIEEIDTFEPELAKKLRGRPPTNKNPLIIEPFVYMMTKSNYVRRLTKRDFLQYGGFRREGQIESWRYAERVAMAKNKRTLDDFEEAIK